jgi:hypothetical protein
MLRAKRMFSQTCQEFRDKQTALIFQDLTPFFPRDVLSRAASSAADFITDFAMDFECL